MITGDKWQLWFCWVLHYQQHGRVAFNSCLEISNDLLGCLSTRGYSKETETISNRVLARFKPNYVSAIYIHAPQSANLVKRDFQEDGTSWGSYSSHMSGTSKLQYGFCVWARMLVGYSHMTDLFCICVCDNERYVNGSIKNPTYVYEHILASFSRKSYHNFTDWVHHTKRQVGLMSWWICWFSWERGLFR